jgi:hypothetical protein
VRGPGYKDGGHADEAQDKKLIAKMMKSKKYAGGGKVTYHEDGDEVEPQASSTSVSSPANASQTSAGGIMKALGGLGKSLSPTASGSTGIDAVKAAQAAQTAAEKAGQSASASTQNLGRSASQGFKPGAVPGAMGGGGANKFQIAKDGGGIKKLKAGGATGQGRLAKIAGARAVPAKTEI